MAEIAASLAGPVIDVMRWVAAPIVRQFNYLCCFTANITNLQREAEELGNVARGLQEKVNREVENLQVIVPTVESWLTKSKDINDQTNEILGEVPTVTSGCLKLPARFSLSKSAKKTTDRMKELRGQCNFSPISQPGPPAATRVVPPAAGTTLEFESRKRFEEDIMTTLRLGEAKMIGICGMGGLGKTTMANRIMGRVLEEHVFKEAVIAVVSQQVDKTKIQEEIGGSLGLDLKKESSQARKQKLHERLSAEKRTLLVLDDVWDGLELGDLGVPCDSRWCTVLITSRNNDALKYMNVQKVFGMKVLKEEEAWSLFREKAGTCVDDSELNSIARDVVKECNGLPIALKILGASLKDDKSVAVWKDALRKLRQSVHNIPDVYNPLKLSYERLPDDEAKSLFLLCCLFPEDDRILLWKLTSFCMGLGIFEGIYNLEEARNRTLALTRMLKSRSLLLDGDNDNHVRMHDVVRDVCIFIAKQERFIGGNDCTWIPYWQPPPTRLEFPKLRLLSLNLELKEQESELDSAFFEGSRDLNVLYIKRSYSLTSLPHTTDSLTNLKTLVLQSCGKLKTISAVGELVNLEILICRDCISIEELPLEMKRLKRLKLFELLWCYELQTIGGGIISGLVGLEELKMRGSFKKWEAEDSELKENARLRELEDLRNLRCLEIEIEDAELAAEQMNILSKLQKFNITFSEPFPSYRFDIKFNFYSYPSHKKLSARLNGGIGDWLRRDTECLYLSGRGANNVELAKYQNMRWLGLESCEAMKNIVRSSVVDNATVFPSLEYLFLTSLPQLEEISDAPISSTSFQNLSSIEIWECHSLRNLGQLSIAGKDCLLQLQHLTIFSCEKMEQVFLWNENTNPQTITKIFPRLEKVELRDLPNLATFYQGIEGIEFPLLTTLEIVRCPKFNFFIGMGSNEKKSVESNNADIQHSSHWFCQSEKVSFGNLKKLKVDLNPFCTHEIHASSFNGLESLEIYDYHGSMSLPSSIAKNLVNLKSLTIRECNEMVQVIEGDCDERTAILFPKLLKLELGYLPKLVSFCEWKCDVELPSLTEVKIVSCPEMKYFSLGFLAAPKLESLETDYRDLEVGVNVSFDRLKKLKISWSKHPFYHHKLFMSLVNEVEELSILYCDGSVSLIPASIARTTFNFRVLDICHCRKMEKVIEDDEEEKVVSGGQRTLLFPNLEKLILHELPGLLSFCEWTCDIELPSLTHVEIQSCPNLKHFSLGPLTTPKLEIVQIDNKDIGAEKNLNGALQQHYLEQQEKEELRIKLDGRVSLFPASIARTTFNCRVLEISSCWNMEKVIEDDEEEKVVSSGQRTLLFPNLEKLILDELPGLLSFCEWTCDIELPSLREVKIRDCPNLKQFSLGPLTTPKLEIVQIDNKDIGAEKNLNGAMQQHYWARAKEEEEEEEEEEKKNKESGGEGQDGTKL